MAKIKHGAKKEKKMKKHIPHDLNFTSQIYNYDYKKYKIRPL